MGAMVVALGFAVLFNFVILRVKWNRGDYADVFVDVAMLVLLNSVFGGSILGVVSATAGSTLISLYLMWKPVRLFEAFEPYEDEEPSEIDIALEQMQERIDALTKRKKK
jgi:hypothetical protein